MHGFQFRRSEAERTRSFYHSGWEWERETTQQQVYCRPQNPFFPPSDFFHFKVNERTILHDSFGETDDVFSLVYISCSNSPPVLLCALRRSSHSPGLLLLLLDSAAARNDDRRHRHHHHLHLHQERRGVFVAIGSSHPDLNAGCLLSSVDRASDPFCSHHPVGDLVEVFCSLPMPVVHIWPIACRSIPSTMVGRSVAL